MVWKKKKKIKHDFYIISFEHDMSSTLKDDFKRDLLSFAIALRYTLMCYFNFCDSSKVMALNYAYMSSTIIYAFLKNKLENFFVNIGFFFEDIDESDRLFS
jgi:hypothetical protein